MLAASFLLLGGLIPILKHHDRINFVEKAYHGHYRVLRREDADPKLKELGYYNWTVTKDLYSVLKDFE